jgi:pilus assembly protein CpaE
METPVRVDELFIERSAQILDNSPAADRLSVLASEERLAEQICYEPGAAEKLMRIMQRRYAVIVGDVPLRQELHVLDFLGLAQRRILVMEPTLVSVRDTLRMLGMPIQSLQAGAQSQRPIIVLNRADQPGTLSRDQVAEGLGLVPDVTIADLPKQLGPAATLGLPQAAMRGKFRKSILDLAAYAAFERLLDSPTLVKGQFNRREGDRWFEKPSGDGPRPGPRLRFGRRK